MKKFFALILAVLMLVGLCTACQQGGNSSATPASSKDTASQAASSATPKAPVTICYYYKNAVGEQQYTKQVAAKLNEQLSKMEGYEHITLELVPGKEYETEFTLAETSNKQIDLVSTFGLDFTTACTNGSFIELTQLLAAHPDTVSEVPTWLVEMGKINGTQYYIPTYQRAAAGRFFVTPTSYLEKANITIDQVRSIIQTGSLTDKLDFLEKYCKDVRAGTGLDTKWISMFNNFDLFNEEYVDEAWGQWILRENSDGPEYWPFTEDAKTCFEYAAKWYQEGLIHPDIATLNKSDFIGKNFLNKESWIFYTEDNVCSDEAFLDTLSYNTPETPMSATFCFDHYYIGSTWAAGGNAIHSTCKNPDEAMQIVELLMTKKGEEFYNTLCWGLENVHWEWVDQSTKRIKTLEFDGSQGDGTTTYCTWKWNVGNTFNAWNNQAVTDEYNDFILNQVHNASTTVTSKMMGYTWDLSSVVEQRASCKAVSAEYYSNLSRGIYGKDWEEKYNEYIERLKVAGVQDVLDCMTKQYNDYLSSKK